MADQNQLEAERDRLRSMIACHDDPSIGMLQDRPPVWFVVIAAAAICTIGISLVAGVFVGQISASSLLFLVVALPLLAYIFSRKITVFGSKVLVGEILALFGGALVVPPG